MTLTDYAPFGVIGSITPVTHSLPTLAANAINMLAAGNTVVFNAHPSGAKIAAEGVRRFNKGIKPPPSASTTCITLIDPPTLESAAALFDHRAVKPAGRHRRPGRGEGGAGEQASGDRRGAGQPAGRRGRDGLTWTNAAKSIVFGAAFDNNLLCIGEKQVFAVSEDLRQA